MLAAITVALALAAPPPAPPAPPNTPLTTREMERINWMEFREQVPSRIETVLLPLGTLEAHGVTANGADIRVRTVCWFGVRAPVYTVIHSREDTVPAPRSSAVVTLRVSRDLDRAIAREARRRRQTRSAVLREILERALEGGAGTTDPAVEARRQSLRVSRRASERESLEFVEQVADRRGWR